MNLNPTTRSLIYLDNSATTRACDEAVAAVVVAMQEEYGNPSSMHGLGAQAEHLLRGAVSEIAAALKVSEKEIILTSGGTESDNLAVLGAALAYRRRGMHVITTAVEHPAVNECFKKMETLGFQVTYLPVDQAGRVRVEDLFSAITPETILVSMMMVNNEVGARMPVEEVGARLKKEYPDILFFVDAVQGFGKYPVTPSKWGVDLLSFSGHKIHGPKGTGVLYVRDKVRLEAQILGGGQQKAKRSGTENVPGYLGLAAAVKRAVTNLTDKQERMTYLKDRLYDGLSLLPDVVLHSARGTMGACHIVNASFMGVRAEVLLHALEDKGICVSAGSACASNKPAPSKTLLAMGLPMDQIESALRFSLSEYTTEEEIDVTLEELGNLLPLLRRFKRK